jgi:ketosteroid isomerase-like protein
MSGGNVELVRSIVADWERGDYFGRSDWADPEMEWVFADGPAPVSGVGFHGAADAWRDWLAAWGLLGVKAEEYREPDDESVLVCIEQRMRGRKSAVEVRAAGASLFQVRGGKVIRLVHYSDRDVALADLGLEA